MRTLKCFSIGILFLLTATSATAQSDENAQKDRPMIICSEKSQTSKEKKKSGDKEKKKSEKKAIVEIYAGSEGFVWMRVFEKGYLINERLSLDLPPVIGSPVVESGVEQQDKVNLEFKKNDQFKQYDQEWNMNIKLFTEKPFVTTLHFSDKKYILTCQLNIGG